MSTSPSLPLPIHSRNPSALHHRRPTPSLPTNSPVLSTADSACYVSGRPTSTLPLRPYHQPSIPSFYLSRPPFNDVTGCPTLRSTKFIYRRIIYIYIYILHICICIFVYNVIYIDYQWSTFPGVFHKSDYSISLNSCHLSLSFTFSCFSNPASIPFSLSSSSQPTVSFPLVANLINAKESLLNIKKFHRWILRKNFKFRLSNFDLQVACRF